MSERLCLSCEQPIANRAKEHVIPEWLLKVLDVQHEQLIQAIAAGAEEQIQQERRFTFNSFQVDQGRSGPAMLPPAVLTYHNAIKPHPLISRGKLANHP
jgi:hypothetical protein